MISTTQIANLTALSFRCQESEALSCCPPVGMSVGKGHKRWEGGSSLDSLEKLNAKDSPTFFLKYWSSFKLSLAWGHRGSQVTLWMTLKKQWFPVKRAVKDIIVRKEQVVWGFSWVKTAEHRLLWEQGLPCTCTAGLQRSTCHVRDHPCHSLYYCVALGLGVSSYYSQGF